MEMPLKGVTCTEPLDALENTTFWLGFARLALITLQLEEKEKSLMAAEAEVNALNRFHLQYFLNIQIARRRSLQYCW